MDKPDPCRNSSTGLPRSSPLIWIHCSTPPISTYPLSVIPAGVLIASLRTVRRWHAARYPSKPTVTSTTAPATLAATMPIMFASY
jgi:hypothetical protein